MTRDEIINQLREFFQIRELVCDHVFSAWGQRAWQFLDTTYLHNLLIIRRDILKAPMICNHASANQRGLRCNRCPMAQEKTTPYLSSHVLGQAGDFTVQGMTAQEARSLIRNNANLLPYPLRMEGGVSWLHIDTLPQYGITSKVYEFSA